MTQPVEHGHSPNSSQNKSTLGGSTETNGVTEFSELFTGDSLLELCNSFWMRSPSANEDVQPYLRGCKWSPDGTCCLSVVNHDGFHIMELPRDLYEGCPSRDRMITLLPAVIHVKESGTVYDFSWYPKMNSHYPETCSWISTKINSPIQMWDAYDGSLRCSYRGFNAVDEMEPAISVTFINEGQRIVGGYRNCLRTFDVERPGRDFFEHKIKSPASCFATHGNLLAVGSWNANIKLFSILDNGTYKSVANLHAHTGGITHLKFTPDGTKLVSGARKDNSLCVWDVRYHKRPLNILKRSVSTNQRIYFDISPCGRYLVSGGTDGVVRVWDDKFTKWTEQFNVNRGNQENATFRFQLYRDCCNSISIHPSRPILATGSGQFHFLDPVKILESECDSGTNCDDSVTVEPQSAAHGSSSDEQRLDETVDIPLAEVHKMDVSIENGVQTHENTSSEVHAVDSAEELTNKTSDHDIDEVSRIKMYSQETSSDLPPHKKRKWNDITSNTDKKINEKKDNPKIIPITDKSNLERVNEEPSTKKVKLNEANNDENNFGSETKIDTDKRVTSEVTERTQLLTTDTKECNLTIIKQPFDCNSKQCSVSEPVVKDKNHIDSPTKLDKLVETHTAKCNKEPITSQEDPHSHLELASLTDSDSFDEYNSRSLNTDGKCSKKVRAVEKLPDSIVDSALESDGGCNDINENQMKYSTYVENNLTFWWIAKT